MKKIIAVLMVLVSLCGCSDGEKEAVRVRPSEVLTQNDVDAILAHETVSSEEMGREVCTVSYLGEETGEYDPVYVELIQCSEQLTKEELLLRFGEERSLRPKATDVNDFTAQCYIAYPSIHICKDDYYVKITAGSGADAEQEALLKSLAKLAVDNIDKLK